MARILIKKGGTVIDYFYHSTLEDIESVKQIAKELYLEFPNKHPEKLTEVELQQLNPENWKEILTICCEFTVLLASGEHIIIYTLSQDARDEVYNKLCDLDYAYEDEHTFNRTADIGILYNHDSLLKVCLASRGVVGYTEEEIVLREKEEYKM